MKCIICEKQRTATYKCDVYTVNNTARRQHDILFRFVTRLHMLFSNATVGRKSFNSNFLLFLRSQS